MNVEVMNHSIEIEGIEHDNSSYIVHGKQGLKGPFVS